jgi:aspartate/methionine/tyrosine aminotransferase
MAHNRLTEARARLEARGTCIIDLTVSNPTQVSLDYPSALRFALDSGHCAESLGLESARESVASYLRRHQLDVYSQQVVLTASTSEAYGLLFKLLCDPGDEVAIPRPSYPLLEYLTRFESVVAVPYTLELHANWAIDVAALRSRVTPRTRAVVIVNPNNPTGSFVSSAEIREVSSLCREHGLALIVDEVFGFYPLTGVGRGPSVLDEDPAVLTFVLGGLSKAVGLPGLKLGWMVATGPSALVAAALERLELICDTYLSVAIPVQLALGALLDQGRYVTRRIAARVRQNHACLAGIVLEHLAADLLPVEGGWYAVIRVPATVSEECLTLDLLERAHVLVYPGYFFDFPTEAFLVISLLPEPRSFEYAVRRLLSIAAGSESSLP